MTDAVTTASSAGPSLSDQHKDSVRRWIGQLRASLEDDFAAALQRYGFRRDGRHAAERELALPMSELAARCQLPPGLGSLDRRGRAASQPRRVGQGQDRRRLRLPASRQSMSSPTTASSS